MKKLLSCLFILALIPLQSQDRRTLYPYLAGDTFREFAEYVYDETTQDLKPEDVRAKGTIFVKTDLLNEFFQNIHPHLPPYILITHNSDLPIPRPYQAYLEDPKLIAWFGINVENFIHNKLHPIPIGITNRYNSVGGDLGLIQQMEDKLSTYRKKHLLYLNFSLNSYPKERYKVYNLFKSKKFCLVRDNLSYRNYYTDIAESKFVLSPRGNGLDCHRTWEALYLNAIPVVRTSSIDSLYNDLPVLIVKQWEELNEKSLNQKYKQLSITKNRKEKLKADYWYNKIRSYQ